MQSRGKALQRPGKALQDSNKCLHSLGKGLQRRGKSPHGPGKHRNRTGKPWPGRDPARERPGWLEKPEIKGYIGEHQFHLTPSFCMHSFRADQFRMMGVLAPWLTTNQAAIAKSKIAAKEAADVTAGLPAVQGKAGLTATETKKVTERRNQQQEAFETRLLAMLGPMQMMATAASDLDLLGLVTIGRTTFRRLRPELQAGVGQQVLAKAKANAKKLEDYAIDADYLAEAQTQADTFQQGLPATQSLLDARQNANATYEEVHEAQMTQIYELDKAMSVFEAVNPDLFKGYKAARALLDSAGGKAKKGPQPG